MSKKLELLYWLATFIVLSIIYSMIAKNIIPNSDVMSSFREARDITEGNIFLSGWDLSTISFYFTEIIPYAIAIKIIGFNENLYYIVPGIFMSMLVTLSLYISHTKSRASLWPVLSVFGIPTVFSSSIMLIACIHIGAYIYMLAIILIIDRYRKKNDLKLLFPYVFMLSLLVFSDDISKYAFIIPIVFVCIYRMYASLMKRDSLNTNDLLLLVFTISSIFIAELISFIFIKLGGFNLPGITKPHIVEFQQITSNISLVIMGVFKFFGGYAFGMEIGSFNSLFTMIKVFFIFVFLFLSYKNILKFKEIDFIDQVLIVSSLVMLIAYVSSDRPTNLFSIRYIVPTFIFMSIVIARNSFSLPVKTNLLISLIVIALSLPTMATTKNIVNKNDITIELRDFLIKNKLQRGYASFWFASSVAGFSDINVAPFESYGDRFTPYNWLSKKEWYQKGANFLIADDVEQEEKAIKQFGQPDSTHKIQDKKVLIWKNGIDSL